METLVPVCALLSLAALTASVGGAPSQRAGYVWYALYPSQAVRKTEGHEYDDSSLVWKNCGSGGSAATVTSVTINPDPPQKGSDLTVSSVFKLDEEIPGGTMKVKLYYAGTVRVMDKQFDICTLAKKAGEQCPLAAGTQTISFTETMPSYVPPGTYSGTVKAMDLEGKEMACVKIEISI